MAGNRLAGETSPYLLQHKDNPVDWMPWGPEALDLARRENRPILLSVGYAACHWCHVMAHESFEDPDTAALMNRLFVNIKVDREERPDLDAIYQTSLAMLGEQGGWPLTMFLTPDGHPFWGGTYFPPEARYGRPGFRDVLAGIAAVYRNDPERVRKNVGALTEALNGMAKPQPGAGITPETLGRIAARVLQEVDLVRGGTHGAPKFPQPPLFQQLWRAWRRGGDERYRDAVTVTLDNICQGGLYDHLGGGFARYSVDDRWLAPHFEKMLYDNAQLLELLVAVWRETQNPLYAARIEETVDWLLRDMQDPDGGFASSLDADSEGVEGKYYVWNKAEIDDLLGDDAGTFAAFYDVAAPGNWEGTTILNRLGAMALSDAATEATLAAARARLLAARGSRIPPGKDDKVLADWNGLAISALAIAGQAFDRADWIDAAQRALAFVRHRMTEGGRLRHSWRDGRLNHPATLDDYANMARAALLLYEATGDAALVAQAETWVDCVRAHHADDEAGGYFFAAADTPDLIVRNKTATDNPTPSGNGVMVEVLARLWLLTGRDSCREEAEAVLRAFSGEVNRNFFPLSTLLSAAEFLSDPAQIVVIGAPGSADTTALLAAARRHAPPAAVLQPIAPDTLLPDGHPAAGKVMQGGGATAYLCRGQSCSLPISSPADLVQALTAR